MTIGRFIRFLFGFFSFLMIRLSIAEIDPLVGLWSLEIGFARGLLRGFIEIGFASVFSEKRVLDLT